MNETVELVSLGNRYGEVEPTPEQKAAWDAHIAESMRRFREAKPELTPSWVLPRSTAGGGRAGHDSNVAE